MFESQGIKKMEIDCDIAPSYSPRKGVIRCCTEGYCVGSYHDSSFHYNSM